MKFRTEITFCSEKKISHKDNIMFIGSCFSSNVGNYFTEYRFQTDVNHPFGILFNPSSIAKSLQRLISRTPYTECDLFFHNGLWHSYDHHSSFSNATKDSCLENINKCLNESADFLRKTNVLFITFGTAWIFRKKDDHSIVSNCHKMPESTFVREKLSMNEIVEDYVMLINELRNVNPTIRIIFTVSPIRHKNDGLHGNQLSKATLLLAIDELQRKIDNIEYFPSYEIMMDDLRDYRYYDEDLLHPNNVALKYIQEKIDGYFNEDTKLLMQEIAQVNLAEKHRPSNAESEEYKAFIAKIQIKEEEITRKRLH